jgi:hypothetical protein
VQDDQAHPTPSDGPQSGRHFELPQVRELRPEPGRPPADVEAEDCSPSSFPRSDELSSSDEAATGEPLAAGRRDTFQRRWEHVQARFVEQAARRVDVKEE